MKKVIEHKCHYCITRREVKIIEEYPCGARLVIDSMIGVCCFCKIRFTLWGGKPTIRGKNQPDKIVLVWDGKTV